MASIGDTEDPNSNSASEASKSPSQPPVASPQDDRVLSESKSHSPQKSEEETEKAILQATRTVEWLQLGVNVVLAGIGVFAVLIYGGQLREMGKTTQATIVAANAAAKQAEISSRQLELAERPWITIKTNITSPLTYYGGKAGAVMHIHTTVTNTGTTPAVGIFVNGELYTGWPESNPYDERRKLCQGLGQNAAQAGDILFPNASQDHAITLQILGKDIPEAVRRSGFGSDAYTATIIVCVNYRPFFRPETRYYTGVKYDVLPMVPAHAGVSMRNIQLREYTASVMAE